MVGKILKSAFSRSFWTKTGRISAALFTITILIASISILLAWTANTYWLTELLSKFYDIHVFNSDTRKYFETLTWLLIITSIQFYSYFRYTMQLYDSISVENSGFSLRLIHHSLQFFVFTATFVAGLIIFVAFFETFLAFEIMNEKNVDVKSIITEYLPLLKLTWLILTFVVLDILLICLNFNYTRCTNCPEGVKKDLTEVRTEAGWSIIGGLLLMTVQFAVFFTPKSTDNPYHITNNLEVGSDAYLPVFLIGLLQLLYLFFNLKNTYKPVLQN